MNTDEAANRHAVFDRGMAADAGDVRHHVVAPDMAVVADMRVRHNKIVVADARFLPFAGRAMEGDAFTDDVVRANDQIADFAFKLAVLRRAAKNRAGVDFGAFPNVRMFFYNDVRMHLDALRQLYLVADDGVWPNVYVFRQFRSGVHRCSGMNVSQLNFFAPIKTNLCVINPRTARQGCAPSRAPWQKLVRLQRQLDHSLAPHKPLCPCPRELVSALSRTRSRRLAQ